MCAATRKNTCGLTGTERTGEDAVGVVVDVATAITREVRRAIGAGGRSVRPEVLDLYLRGQFAYRSLTRDGLDRALAHYRRTVALDADFTLGWAAIGATRTVQAFMGFLPPGDALPEGRDALERALRLDPGLGEAYGHLGYIALYFDRDFEKARRTLELARSLSPDSMMIRHEHADYLLVRGRVDDSLAEVQAGRSNDPTAWPGHGVVLYHALLARRFDIVLADGLKVLEAMPTRNTRTVHSWIARALWMTGRELEALERMRSVYEMDEAAWVRVERATRQLGARAGMAELARWMAAREPKNLQAGAFETAILFAAAGDTASALAWLERSDARREPFLLHAGADPFLDPISSDSRFLSFLKRLDITLAPR